MTELNKRIITSFFLIVAIFFSFLNLKILYCLILILNFIAFGEFIKIFKKIYKSKFFQFFAIFLSLIYLTYFSLIIISFLTSSFETNKYQFLFLLLICISTDIGGFCFGKVIGGKKLTKISPNKTYSGLIGSFIVSIAVGCIYYYTFNYLFLTNLNILSVIILISFISQIGDLLISYFKRQAKIKDTGTLLPGHGGILDRIDGILLALPLGIIIISS